MDKKKKVLVVDDDTMCRKAVANFAKKLGVEADSAGSGKEAIEKIQSEPSSYFLIMIDMYMPDMNGYQTAKELKAIAKNDLGSLVVMSGDELQSSEYESHGFQCFIQKPVSKSSFEKILSQFNK